jgi:signal transduction histidine kinase
MVKKAVAFIKEQGADKAYPEFTGKDAKFIDRDLYVVVYQLDGKVLAHGSNPKFVGKDMSDAQDVDGKLYVKERVELAGKQASFWQDYKFVNPVSKKVEPKQMYCEKLENTAVCAGIYKD